MKIKRILALLLVAVTLLSLAACGNRYVEDKDGVRTFFYGYDEDLDNFPSIANPIDPQEIYNSMEYTEKMFYGRYRYDGSIESFSENAVYMPIDYVDYANEIAKDMVSTVPYEINVGPSNCGPGRRNREHEWADLTFANDDGRELIVTCTYTVSGNSIAFTPVAQYEVLYESYVEDGKTYTRESGLSYELGTQPLTYTFSFRGPHLTLSNGSETVIITSYSFNTTLEYAYSFSGTADPNSPTLPDINYISGYMYRAPFDKYSRASFSDKGSYGDEGYVYHEKEMVSYREDGLMTLIWSHDDEYGKEIREVRQFVAFIGGDGSLVLVDENLVVYYYTQTDDSYLLETISQGMTSEELLALEALEQAEMEAIVQKKADLLTDLSAAFQEAGLSVQINEATGEIAMDSTVLFAVDKSDISAEGKEMLSKFMQVYTSVVFNDEYNGFVSRIMVEGHTDTDGTYELNQTLSQARADAVREFCLSTESGIDAAYQQQLAASLSAVGYSWDYPVYAADGTVDMAASRRVAFRFIINVNQ